MTENIANPEKKLVPELMAQTSKDCLYLYLKKIAMYFQSHEPFGNKIEPIDIVIVLIVASEGNQ